MIRYRGRTEDFLKAKRQGYKGMARVETFLNDWLDEQEQKENEAASNEAAQEVAHDSQ